MKIAVKNIAEDGLEIVEKVDANSLGLGIKDRLSYETPLEVRALATRTGRRGVRILGEASAGIRWICSRCLEGFRQPLRRKFDLHYTDKDENSVIDPTDLIREEVLLVYPMQTNCKDNCKGLCPQCGHNLNKGLCNCRNNGNSPFGKLKDIVR